MKPNEKIVCLLLLTCFVTLTGPLHAGKRRMNPGRPGDAASKHMIQLKMYRNFLMVAEGQFGGVPEVQNFVLDTGTAPSIINIKIVNRLGLATSLSTIMAVGKTIPAQAAIIPDIELGPIHAVNVPVRAEDLSRLEREWGIPIAGIIGLDVLSKSNFRLDYDKGEVEFGQMSHEGVPVHFDARASIAVAEVNLAGRSLRLLVDTGSHVLVLFGENIADVQGLELRKTSRWGASFFEQKIDIQEFSAPDIIIGKRHFSTDRAYFVRGSSDPDFDGLLGVRALGFRALSFDQVSETIFLER